MRRNQWSEDDQWWRWGGWRVRMKKSFAGKAGELWCEEREEASEAAA